MATPKKGDTVSYKGSEVQIMETIKRGENASEANPQYKVRTNNGVKIVDRKDIK